MKFTFFAGYQTPHQFHHQIDDEDSISFCLEADNLDSAVLSGAEIMEQVMSKLFYPSVYSWKAHQFAFWAEQALVLETGPGDGMSLDVKDIAHRLANRISMK